MDEAPLLQQLEEGTLSSCFSWLCQHSEGSWCKSAPPWAAIKEANVSTCQLQSWRVMSVDSAKPLWKADLEESKTNNEEISPSWLC